MASGKESEIITQPGRLTGAVVEVVGVESYGCASGGLIPPLPVMPPREIRREGPAYWLVKSVELVLVI